MIGFGMSFQAMKSGFFDRERVMRSMDAATRRVFTRFGGRVRTRARRSIRKRKGISPPGQPPHSHVGLLRDFIFFAYDPWQRSVVIGPVLLRLSSKVPSLLEYGGVVVRRTKKRTRRLRYRPRPYMRPAFEQEKPRLPDLWRDSVR